MKTLIHERVKLANVGQNPKSICRVPSGWVVLGDVQFLRGYCLLLPDPALHAHIFPRFNDEPAERKSSSAFFYDWKSAPAFALPKHHEIMAQIGRELKRAYSTLRLTCTLSPSLVIESRQS